MMCTRPVVWAYLVCWNLCLLLISGVMFGQQAAQDPIDRREQSSRNRQRPARGVPLASSPLDRPVLGYVAWPSPLELRAILGVPGAAVFSDPLALPEGTRRLHLAPGHSYGLIERGGQPIAAAALDGLQVGAVQVIPGAPHSVDLIAFSPKAQSAVLFSADLGRLQVIAGLPQAPHVVQSLQAATLPGLPARVAVNDDASLLLVASEHAVHLLSADGTSRLVVSVQDGASLTFLSRDGSAVILDHAIGSVYLVPSPAAATPASLLASGLTGGGEMHAGSEGNRLLIMDHRREQVQSVDVGTGEVRPLDLPVPSTRLEPLRIRDAFLVSAEPHQSAWICLADSKNIRAVFIPAPTREPR